MLTASDDDVEVFVGAGDIAQCNATGDEATAALLDNIAGTVFTTGDNAYEDGTEAEYEDCYDPSWGRHKARTRPVPGNHEYNTTGATGYFNYFGPAAGEPGKGYYSYDLGDWHIIALNNYVPMTPGSEQHNWLQADLAATTQTCKLAYYHEPLYSSLGGSGSGGTTVSSVKPLFRALYDAGVNVVVNGHRHFYERLAPMNPDGQADEQGIRQFIVGNGGTSIVNPTNVFPLSEVRFGDNTHGVLKFYLYEGGYAWKFVPVPGKTLSDTGSAACLAESGVDPALSTVSAQPTSIMAGGETAQITVTVRDPAGNPMSGVNVVLTTTGTGNDLTQPSSPTDVNGVATGSLSSTVADLKTVSARANFTLIAQTAAVTVTPGSLSATQSTVAAVPDHIAPGTATAMIIVTAADVHGNPISGAQVLLAATGSGNTLTQPAGTTDQNGVATGSLSSTVEETKTVSATVDGTALTHTASVTVTTQPPLTITHTLLTGGNSQVNQKVYTTAAIAPAPNTLVTVAVLGHRALVTPPTPSISGGGMTGWTEVASIPFDPLGTSLKRLTIYRAMSPAPGSGPLTIAFSATVSNCQWIVSQWDGVDLTGVNGAGAIGQIGSNRGDGVSGLTVPLAPFANPKSVAYGVFGVRSQVLAVTPGPGFTELSEQPSAESPLSDLQAEWATNVNTIAALWTALNGGALGVEIRPNIAGVVDPLLSTVSVAPTEITPGGAGSTITVRVKDGHGDPISGATVVLAATGSENVLTQPPGATDESGEAEGILTSTIPEEKTVSATVTVEAVTTAIDQTATVTVNPALPIADLSITKTDGLTSVDQGSAVTYTIVVTNAGPSAVTGATVSDDFPDQVNGVSWTCAASAGSACPANGTGDIATSAVDLESGGTATFTASGTVEGTGTIVNTAAVAAPAGVDDPPENNSATDDNTVIAADADLSITKTDGLTSVDNGGTVTYTIAVSNAGPSEVTGATVSDDFPDQLSGVSWTCAASAGSACPASGTGDIATSTVDLESGGTATFTASGTVVGAGTLVNTAMVTAPAGVNDPAENNSATDDNTVIVAAEADLSITKTDGLTSVNQGNTVTYTIVVSNAGPSAVAGATVNDGFPAQLSGVSWTCVASASSACPASGTGDIATSAVHLASGGTATFTASGTVVGTGTLVNTATVTAPAGVNDPAGNNSATDDNTVIAAVETINHTLLTGGNSQVNQKVYTTATIAPAPNTLVTVAVLGHRALVTPPTPTLSGGGMTAWTEVASIPFDPLGTSLKRLTIYRAMSPAPGSGPLTITFSATVSNCQWIVSQWDGVDLTGVNGAGAIGQTGANQGDGVSGLTIPLAAFGTQNNVGYGVFGVRSQVLAVSPGTGFTEIGEQPSAESPPSDLQAEWATNVNTIAALWTALNGGALGVEIKARITGP